MKMTYHTVMEAEVKADVYSGENCDEVTKYVEMYVDGDMDKDTSTDDITIQLKYLPPGARIRVEYPCCPSCGMHRFEKFEYVDNRYQCVGHEEKCECGFDWDSWVQEQYA